jgi:molecular chaperone DnaK (HSP70)
LNLQYSGKHDSADSYTRRLDDPSGATTDTKPPEELTQIYLSHLYTHMKYSLEKSLSASTVRSTPIDYVITVPAIWTEAAKQKTLTAAEKAGFKSNKKTYLVSEPVSWRL